MQWQYFLHFFLILHFLVFPFFLFSFFFHSPSKGSKLLVLSHAVYFFLLHLMAFVFVTGELHHIRNANFRWKKVLLWGCLFQYYFVFIRFMMDGIIARRVRMKIKTLSALWEEKEKMRHRNSHKSGDGPKVHSARRERPLAPSSHSPVGPFSRVEPFRLPLGGRRRSKGFLSRARTMQVDVGHGCRLILCWICLQCPQSCQAWF